MKKPKLIQTEIQSITSEGLGLSLTQDKQLYSIGAYPGETITGQVIKKRKGKRWLIPAEDSEIEHPSAHRIEAREDHYLSCSPWQTISYDYQVELKKEMLAKAYDEYAGEALPIHTFYGAQQQTEYRTKMEFSFWNDKGLYLAFHKRGSPFVNVTLPQGCLLGSKKINEVALAICKAIETAGIEKRNLKTLTLRESKSTGDIIGLLLVTFEEIEKPFSLPDIPGLKGVTIAYSSPLSPASRIDTILYQEGQDYLDETIDGLSIRYPLDGFFQNNIELFEKALHNIKDVVKSCSSLLELYSGVGTIGLALHAQARKITGVEVVPSSVLFANENARRNNIKNYFSIEVPAEKMDAKLLHGIDVLVLDPPRSGLHPDVVKSILEATPQKIVYLSCNPSTQARDYALLKTAYTPLLLNGYDFYPQTMHMESLLVLEKKL
jgi:23S rRNA (uracil1939-C5)-methyltransferase